MCVRTPRAVCQPEHVALLRRALHGTRQASDVLMHDFLSESEPQYQDMLDEGLARYFNVKWVVLGKDSESCSVGWHGDPVKIGQCIALMRTAGCRPWRTARRGSGAGAGIRDVHQHGPARCAAQFEDGGELDCNAC